MRGGGGERGSCGDERGLVREHQREGVLFGGDLHMHVLLEGRRYPTTKDEP